MNRRLIIRHIFYFSIIAIYCFVLYRFRIYCPIRYFLHVPCPACGMTRSLLSLFRLDINAFFSYNPMTIPILFAVFYGIHGKTERFKMKGADKFIIITAVVTFIIYIVRLKFNMIP